MLIKYVVFLFLYIAIMQVLFTSSGSGGIAADVTATVDTLQNTLVEDTQGGAVGDFLALLGVGVRFVRVILSAFTLTYPDATPVEVSFFLAMPMLIGLVAFIMFLRGVRV